MKVKFSIIGGLLLFGGSIVSSLPARAQAAAMTCPQIEAEIGLINAELAQLDLGMDGDAAAEQRVMNRQLTAATISGLIPVPFLGSIVGLVANSANAEDERRIREAQARREAGAANLAERVPIISERLAMLADLHGRQCGADASGR